MRVCFVPANFDGAGFYRCALPMRELGRRGHECALPPYTVHEGGRIIQWDLSRGLPDADVFVLQMPQDELFVDIARHVQGSGRRVVLELDDYLLKMPGWHPAAVNTRWRSLTSRLARLADMVTVSTPFLQREYGRLNGNTVLLPNFLDREMWVDVPMQYEVERRRVRVGWMGAAGIRSGDVRVLQGVIGPWLERNPNVEFVAAGSPEILKQLGVPDGQGVALPRVPFQRDSVHYLPYITAVMDVGLVPLEEHPFNEGKSALKGMEYAACGIPCVATATESYEQWVEPGVNGFLTRPNKPADWTAALDELVADDDMRREMGRAARAKAEEHWIDDHIELWQSAYQCLDTVGVGA